MLKWAKGSETQERINQWQVWSTSFWQVCMQPACTACRAVKIELKPGLNLMRVPDAPQSALIIRMDMQSSLTALHASYMHCMQTCQDCECFLKSKSLIDMWLPDPYPMQGFLWKGGSSNIPQLCTKYLFSDSTRYGTVWTDLFMKLLFEWPLAICNTYIFGSSVFGPEVVEKSAWT